MRRRATQAKATIGLTAFQRSTTVLRDNLPVAATIATTMPIWQIELPMDSQIEKSVSFRIIDANFNRAAEGLRVVEEHLRFGLNDAHLTLLCKQLRHRLTEAVAKFAENSLIAARDTQHDVGTELQLKTEYRRDTLGDIWRANLKRVQQSLRCMEEYGKTVDASAAQRLEAIRYETYSLEKAIALTSTALQVFQDRRLYVLIDGQRSEEEFRRLVESLVNAGVDVLQLRDKTLGDRQLIERARLLRAKTRETSTLFIMNDRPDLAVLSQADGVHVGQDELPVADARRVVGSEAIVGVSTHSIEQARQAVLDGANYIGVGPTFPSKTKQFDRFPGLDLLKQVSSEISLPAFAIGGVSLDNLKDVWKTGIQRIAVGHAVTAAPVPAEATVRFQTRIADLQCNSRSETECT